MTSPFFLLSRRLHSLVLALLFLSIAVGCSSDDDTTPNSGQLATVEGNWKVNSLKLNGVTDVLPLLTAQYGSCLTDITLSFRAGGAVGFDNPASCSSGTALAAFTAATGINTTSKWSMSMDGKTLTITTTTGTPTTFATAFGTSTVQLQGSGLFTVPGTPAATYNYTLELRKV